MWQNRLNQGCSKKQRRTLCTDKGNNPTRGYNLVNICTPNIVPKHVKEILINIKGVINRNSVIVRDFNTPLTSMDRSSKQKINKETAALNNTLEMHTRSNGFDYYLHSISPQRSRIYILFKCTWNVF